MPRNRRLILAHFWVAFVVFLAAAMLGLWQMWVRSPLSAPQAVPAASYYQSVTAHGVLQFGPRDVRASAPGGTDSS